MMYYQIQVLLEVKSKTLEDALKKVNSIRFPKKLKLRLISAEYKGKVKK